MSIFSRATAYERALKAGRSGADDDAAVMAVALEMTAAQWAFDIGPVAPGSPYAFSPEAAWESAQAHGLTYVHVAALLLQGMDAVAGCLLNQCP